MAAKFERNETKVRLLQKWTIVHRVKVVASTGIPPRQSNDCPTSEAVLELGPATPTKLECPNGSRKDRELAELR